MNVVGMGGGSRTPGVKAAHGLSGQEHPNVLIVPTACSLRSSFDRKVPQIVKFFSNLGLSTNVLHQFSEQPSKEKIASTLGTATLIYTIGGNAPYMLKQMKASGLDTALATAIKQGVVHVGTSAGALLPFAQMHINPSNRPKKELWDFDYADGLSIVTAVATAHANGHDKTMCGLLRPDTRFDHLLRTFPAEAQYGLAIDNGAAVILGDNPGVALADPNAMTGIRLLDRRPDGQIDVRLVEDSSQLLCLPLNLS